MSSPNSPKLDADTEAIIEGFSDRILADADVFYTALKERALGIKVWKRLKKMRGPALDEVELECEDLDSGAGCFVYLKESNVQLLRHLTDHIAGKARAKDLAAGGIQIILQHCLPTPAEKSNTPATPDPDPGLNVDPLAAEMDDILDDLDRELD